MDPALVSVIGLAKDNGGKSSEEVSTTPVGAKAKKMDKNSGTIAVKKTPDSKEPKGKSSKKHHSSPAKSSKVSTDSKLEAMDLRWSERFIRLEATLLAKSINQPEPSFQPVKITPVKPPPAGAVDNTEPFFAPTRATDPPTSSQPTSGPSCSVDRPSSTDQSPTEPASKPSASTSGFKATHRHSDMDMDTDSVTDAESLPRVLGNAEEGEL